MKDTERILKAISGKWLFIIFISGLFLLTSCTHKTGHEHVKISMKFYDNNIKNITATTDIIKNRLMAFGVREKNIRFTIHNNIIDIDVKRINNPERIIFLITTTGKIEFLEIFDYTTARTYLDKADKSLSVMKIKAVVKQASKQELNKNPLSAFILPDDTQKRRLSAELIRSFTEYVKITDTAKVNEMLRICYLYNFFPSDIKFLWSVKQKYFDSLYLRLIAVKIPPEGKALLDGDAVVDAHPSGYNEISISMNNKGAKIWRHLTHENIGRQIAIVLDDYVYSHPTVQTEITGGKTQLSSNFTGHEAEDFATILKFHRLPDHSVLNISVIKGIE